ncbi:MAG TPA: hypothetical protein VIK53_05185 [Verrucomicrobiae bacterium]
MLRWRQARRLSYDLAKLNLEIIPVINKIDLGHADVPQANMAQGNCRMIFGKN